MSGASGSGTGSDSISVRTTSREATPIKDAESASSSMIAGQTIWSNEQLGLWGAP